MRDQRQLRPLLSVLEAAQRVLAEAPCADHPSTCVCSLCLLQVAVDYQLRPCTRHNCGARRFEHDFKGMRRDHAFCDEPPARRKGRGRKQAA